MCSPLAAILTATVLVLVPVFEGIFEFAPGECASEGTNKPVSHLLSAVMPSETTANSSKETSLSFLGTTWGIGIIVGILALI